MANATILENAVIFESLSAHKLTHCLGNYIILGTATTLSFCPLQNLNFPVGGQTEALPLTAVS